MTHTDDTDLADFDDLREIFDRALTDLPVPSARLHDGAMRAGRRQRLRQRVLVGAGGLAAAAAVGAFLVPLAGGSGDTAIDDNSASSPSIDPTLLPDGINTSVLYGDPTGWWDTPSDVMDQVTRPLLPIGLTVTSAAYAPPDRLSGDPTIYRGLLDLKVSTGAGPGSLEVMLYPPQPESVPSPVTVTDADGTTHTYATADSPSFADRTTCTQADLGCTVITDADGTAVGALQTDHEDTGLTTYEATVRHGKGLVYVATSNTLDHKWGEESVISAAEPPMSAEEVIALALSDDWTDWTPPEE